MVHSPPATTVTVAPDTVHTAGETELNDTASPDDADADNMNGALPNTAPPNAPNEIDCGSNVVGGTVVDGGAVVDVVPVPGSVVDGVPAIGTVVVVLVPGSVVDGVLVLGKVVVVLVLGKVVVVPVLGTVVVVPVLGSVVDGVGPADIGSAGKRTANVAAPKARHNPTRNGFPPRVRNDANITTSIHGPYVSWTVRWADGHPFTSPNRPAT